MLGLILGLIVTIIVGYLIVKGNKPQAVLLLGGIILLFLTWVTGIGEILPEESSTGFALFDIFEIIKNTFSSTAGGLGLIIMAVGGFAKYMETIGASEALVDIAVAPLRKLKSPYALIPIGYIIGQILNIFIPSASGLGVLLMVTMYPVLVSLGVSKLAATAMIGTTACLDLGPASGNANLAAEVSGITTANYFGTYQIPTAIPTMIAIAVVHYLVQVYFDKKEGLYMTGDPDRVHHEGLESKIPKIYALLPMLPLILILVFSEFVIDTISMHVVTAMLMSQMLAMVFELIRTKDLKAVLSSIQTFFDGMGSQFAKVITLVVAGQVFADGLTKIGFIQTIISGAQTANLGAIPMTIVMVLIIFFASVIMGSGNAPFFAFAALAPEVASPLGIHPIMMAMPMQLTAGIARSVSPITSVIIAVAGLSNVDTVDVVKRTFLPMVIGNTVMVIASFIFA